MCAGVLFPEEVPPISFSKRLCASHRCGPSLLQQNPPIPQTAPPVSPGLMLSWAGYLGLTSVFLSVKWGNHSPGLRRYTGFKREGMGALVCPWQVEAVRGAVPGGGGDVVSAENLRYWAQADWRAWSWVTNASEGLGEAWGPRLETSWALAQPGRGIPAPGRRASQAGPWPGSSVSTRASQGRDTTWKDMVASRMWVAMKGRGSSTPEWDVERRVWAEPGRGGSGQRDWLSCLGCPFTPSHQQCLSRTHAAASECYRGAGLWSWHAWGVGNMPSAHLSWAATDPPQATAEMEPVAELSSRLLACPGSRCSWGRRGPQQPRVAGR